MNKKNILSRTVFRKLSFWRALWLLFCGFMVVLWIRGIWDVRTEPEQYAFLWGAEGPVAGLWYYASENVYVLHLVGLIIWFFAGVLLCLSWASFSRKLLVAHFVLSVLWVVVTITAATTSALPILHNVRSVRFNAFEKNGVPPHEQLVQSFTFSHAVWQERPTDIDTLASKYITKMETTLTVH